MFIKPFSQISKTDAAIAGGKGASLGEMTQAGIPVPPGFVILSNAFEQFLEETDLNVEIDTILHSVDHREMHTVENASEKIQTLIFNAHMPEDIATKVKEFYKDLGAQYVAVRSSATAEDSASAAWAGQLDSFLNTTEETLLTNVQKCWASLFTPRAIFYRFEKELHKQKISVAVVVQKMVESDCSGIAFSVHPVTEDRNQLIIEAGFGLGEAIVSGSVTPDSYIVEKSPRRIIDTNINTQTRALYRIDSGGNEWRDIPEPKASSQVLTEKQILELSELILRIENHYGFPCDIEWAYEAGTFYITQSRPITTLVSSTSETKYSIARRRYRPVVWPLYTFWRRSFAVNGVPTGKVLQIYDQGMYTAMVDNAAVDALSDKLLSDIETNIETLPAIRQRGLEAGENLASYCENFVSSVQSKSIEDIALFYEKADELHDTLYLNNMMYWASSDKKLHSRLKQRLSQFDDSTREEIIGVMVLPTEETFSQKVEGEFSRLVTLSRKEGVSSEVVQQKIQEFSDAYIWFLYEYAGPAIYDVATVTKRIREELQSAKNTSTRHLAFSKQETIQKYGLDDETIRLFGVAETFAAMQDDRKRFDSRACYAVNNLLLRHLSGALQIPITLLTYLDAELLRAYVELNDKSKLVAELTERANFTVIEQEDGQVRFIPGQNGRDYLKANSIPYKEDLEQSTNQIIGRIAFPGVITAIARILLHNGEGSKLKEGEILVTGMTTPDFVAVMKRAGAIITDEGGITCHAAIMSRELKTPCITGTKIATQVIKDGDLVQVDADNGIVRILKKEST